MKNKTLVSTFLCVLLCNGCVNHISEESNDSDERGIKTVLFKTGLSVTQTPVRSSYNYISKLMVADYQNGVEKQKIEQISSDPTFGNISIPLEYGNHELLFIGHNSVSSITSYPSITFDKTTDTFSYYASMDINDLTSATQNISLDRSVALVKVVAKDAIPSKVSSLKITLSKYYPAMNVKTSLANGFPESIERTFEYKADHVGAKGSTYSIYTFVPSDGFTTDISISSIDSSGEIIHSTTMKDIFVEKNRQTILSGYIFQTEININISINEQWGEKIEIPI